MSGPTTYLVSENVGVLGTSIKQNIDTRKYYFDFSQWLDANETVSLLSNFAVSSVSPAYGWQADFPFPTVAVAATDTNPLTVSGSGTTSPSMAYISVTAGTPGLSYVVSFLATTTLGRQKEVDILVTINEATNANMISSTTPSTLSTTVVNATAALPTGTEGSVYVDNTSGAAITVTLPPSPIQGQALDVIDTAGNAATHNITIQGAAGALISGMASVVITNNYQAYSLEWSGTEWSMK